MQDQINEMLSGLTGQSTISVPVGEESETYVDGLVASKIVALLKQESVTTGQLQLLSVLLSYHGGTNGQSS